MHILSGLFNRMVLQRNSRNFSDSPVTGTTDTDGCLEVRVARKGRRVKSFGGGNVRNGRFHFRLAGVPAGGPYEIELRVRGSGERLVVRDVLVGDVWICAGQSNMQGAGRLDRDIRPHRLVRAFYMDDRWDVARDPIHNLWEAVDPVHTDLGAGPRWQHNVPFRRRNGKPCAPPKLPFWGVGPAVAFGQEMQRRTGVPQGLLACAHGGTSMKQWNPALKQMGGKSLYGAMLRRIALNGGKVAGMIWYQGEADASRDHAPRYTERMVRFIAALRRDCRHASLPVAIVQLCRYASFRDNAEGWFEVQEQQRLLPARIRRLLTVPAVDLELNDGVHLSAAGLHRLGRRLAQAMHGLRGGREAPPIVLKSVNLNPSLAGGYAEIEVRFENVIGNLRANGRAMGFSLGGNDPCPPFYQTELRGDRVILHTQFPYGELSDKLLHYGHPVDPPCNITDAADRSLPVFGPIPVAQPRALTPFVRTLRVSRWMPSDGDLRDWRCPSSRAALALKRRSFPETFLDLHLDSKPDNARVCFACTLRCAERMKLAVCVGYDGPVKIWVDGREIFRDLHGVNPAWVDKAFSRFSATAGDHEVFVGLDMNQGRAWGIFLRFERLDCDDPKRLPRVVG